MRTFLILALGWALPLVLQAQQPLEPKTLWVEQIDASYSLPFSGTRKPDPGVGGDINIGYRFDHALALFVGVGFYDYAIPASPTVGKAEFSYIPLALIPRLTFGEGPLRPYLFCGMGIALNTLTQTNPPGSPTDKTTQAETSFYLSPGLGVLYVFASDMALFLQTGLDMDFASRGGLGQVTGTPPIFIPVKAGISFFVL